MNKYKFMQQVHFCSQAPTRSNQLPVSVCHNFRHCVSHSLTQFLQISLQNHSLLKNLFSSLSLHLISLRNVHTYMHVCVCVSMNVCAFESLMSLEYMYHAQM